MNATNFVRFAGQSINHTTLDYGTAQGLGVEQPLSAAVAVSPPRVWDCHAGKQYPADAVYVGCKVSMYGRTIREGSIFGNGANPLVSHHGSFKTEREFREYATKRMTDPEFRAEVEKLRGKHLLCWCVQDGPKRAEFCHARVWLELANSEGPAIADVTAAGTVRGLLQADQLPEPDPNAKSDS